MLYLQKEVQVQMTMNEYQKLAMRTCSIPYDNAHVR